jgi:hypothetical protein
MQQYAAIRPYDPGDYEKGTYVEYEYHPDIPDYVKGSPIIWKNAAHVGGIFSLHKQWQPHNIPHAFYDRVCFGYLEEDTKSHAEYERRNGIVICGECDKPKVFNTFYCLCCGKFFIRDFVDTRFCPAYPHCWDCIDRYEWNFCPDHAMPSMVAYASTGHTLIRPPAGFNPTVFSDEEIEDFIANELGI